MTSALVFYIDTSAVYGNVGPLFTPVINRCAALSVASILILLYLTSTSGNSPCYIYEFMSLLFIFSGSMGSARGPIYLSPDASTGSRTHFSYAKMFTFFKF